MLQSSIKKKLKKKEKKHYNSQQALLGLQD